MRIYRVYQVNSFTRQLFRGNPAGVVLNAEGLTDTEMQDIARELNNSETAFILPPEDADHDVRIRFFTPTTEVPSCGHATIAAHYARAVENRLTDSTLMHRLNIGVLPVDVVRQNGDYRIYMTQGNIEFGDFVESENRETLLNALGLSPDDLDERCPIHIVSTGHSKVIIGINNREKLHAIAPDFSVLKNLSRAIGCNGYFVFTLDSEDPAILTHARMFAPAIGINEDPVTGNGNGPLGAYLIRYGLAAHDGKILRFHGKQGEAMRREGIVEVKVKIQNGNPVEVKIGGEAVIVFQTEIKL